jgi:cyclase
MEKKMFLKASPLIFERAKALRKNMTVAETVLWQELKSGINGFKFRRQHPLFVFIADFYCHKAKLVIELDGSIHNLKEVKEYDEERQKCIEEQNIKVIRFTNYQVMNELQTVIKTITDHLVEKSV